MATSGQVQSNHVTIGGRPDNFIFANWQLAGQDYGRNVSAINWQVYFHFNGADAQLDGGYFDGGAGRRWSNGGRVYNYAGNFSVRDLGLASGSFEIGHDGAGNANLYISPGITVYQTGSIYGQGNFSLPTIPRDAFLTNLSQDITDEDQPWVEFSNAGGFAVNTWFEFPNNTGATRYHQRNSVGSRFTWNLTEAEKNVMRAVAANQTAITIRYVIETDKGGGGFGYDWRDRTYYIINANPTFPNFTYSDTNTAVTAVTGNNQVLLEGRSTLSAVVSSANKMVALKQSTPVSYQAVIDGIVNNQNYAASGSVTLPIGVINSNGVKSLSVRAIDSRGNSTTVLKNLTVIPYQPVDIAYTAVRENNFDDTTYINISGVFSPIVVGGITKNAIVASSLEYRNRQDGGTWSSWSPITFTQGAGTFTATQLILSLTNSSVWDFQVRISDKIETIVESFSVTLGVPIMMIGDAGRIGVGRMPDSSGRVGLYLTKDDNLWLQMYAIDDIFTTANASNPNPNLRFGGTWTNIGSASIGGVTVNYWRRTA